MKKNIINSIIFTSVMILSLVSAGAAIAGRGNGNRMGGGNGQGMGQNCNIDNLNLTAEQKTAFESERSRFWNETREIRAQIDQKDAEMRTELSKTEVNKEAVQNIQTQISALRSNFDKSRVEHILKIREISPALSERCGGMGMGRGMGMGMMNCPGAVNQNTSATQQN